MRLLAWGLSAIVNSRLRSSRNCHPILLIIITVRLLLGIAAAESLSLDRLGTSVWLAGHTVATFPRIAGLNSTVPAVRYELVRFLSIFHEPLRKISPDPPGCSRLPRKMVSKCEACKRTSPLCTA